MFQLSVGQYDEFEILGLFATENEAWAAFGRYVAKHDGVGRYYPAVTEIG